MMICQERDYFTITINFSKKITTQNKRQKKEKNPTIDKHKKAIKNNLNLPVNRKKGKEIIKKCKIINKFRPNKRA